MLDGFRRAAAKIFATVLFCILILSFALWGIPNYTRDGSNRTLVTVGTGQITEDDYRRFFDNQLLVFSQQAGQRLTRESARMAYKIQSLQQGNFNADLDREVLNLQIDQTLLDQNARLLGLGLSDAAVADAIRDDPAFQGADKKFNRAIFEERVRQSGFTDLGYVRERKSSEIRDQITGSLFHGLTPSAVMIDVSHKFQEERRAVAMFTLDPARQPKVADPDEAKLKEFYEQSKRRFIQPEMRKFAVLMLSRDDIKSRAAIDDAEVKAAWEKDQTSWNIPERRRIQQIVFKTKDAAEAVAKEIAGGKSFLLAALEENGAQGRLDQGLLPRAGVSDPKVAAAAFALPLNQLSEPIEARNGVLLIRVSEIQPGKVRTFDEVAKEVREDLEQKKQREVATRVNEQIEDLRGAGKSLKEIAEGQKLKVVEVAQADRSGKGADGKPALEHPEASRILAAAFEGPKEIPRDMIELSDGSEAWVEVAAITPEQQKPLEAVAEQVKALWLEAETRKALTAAAQAIVDKIKGGEAIDAAAKAAGATLEATSPFRRTDPVAGLPGSAVRQIFTLPKGGLAMSETADGKSRAIYVVTEITPAPAATKEEAERLSKLLQGQLQSDARSSYMTGLRNRIGVTIDEALYKRIAGDERK